MAVQVVESAEQSTPHRKFHLAHEFSFVRIAIEFDKGSVSNLDATRVKFGLESFQKVAFGAVNASANQFDVLRFEKASKQSFEGILRVPNSALQWIWGTLTLCTSLEGRLCRIQVVQVASSLLDLANSRLLP